MIRGIGVDLADIRRIRDATDPAGVLAEVLTPAELGRVSAPRPDARAAALLFAAKEAVVKALGCGMSEGWRWKEIEISQDLGVALSGRLAEIAAGRAVSAIRLTISSFGDHAFALVLLDGTHEDIP